MNTFVTASTVAKVLLALSVTQAPTVAHINDPLLQQVRPNNRNTSRTMFVPTSVASATSATTVANDYSYEFINRTTTPQENIIGEIRQFNLLDANWDGEGAFKPKSTSIKEAVSFVRILDDKIAIPDPMLLASGNTALYWNEGGLYADIEFLGDGRIAYFIKSNGDKHKGILTFDSEKMPAVLQTLIGV